MPLQRDRAAARRQWRPGPVIHSAGRRRKILQPTGPSGCQFAPAVPLSLARARRGPRGWAAAGAQPVGGSTPSPGALCCRTAQPLDKQGEEEQGEGMHPHSAFRRHSAGRAADRSDKDLVKSVGQWWRLDAASELSCV